MVTLPLLYNVNVMLLRSAASTYSATSELVMTKRSSNRR